jgi:succinoglycan biosynthesis protein ExoL
VQPLRVTYFANDLTDPAFVRRVLMLRIGGADIRILGFRRSAGPVRDVEGFAVVDLGRIYHGRLGARSLQVVRRCLLAGEWRDTVAGSDVLLARNLEMATIADSARVRAGVHVPLAYECLDIHRVVLGNGVPAKLLRSWEKRILRRSAMLVVSSPGYVTNYFGRLGVDLPDVILAENKRVLSEGHTELDRPKSVLEARRPPWKIGWFGLLRCIKSFQILIGLAQRKPELVDIELRGRPTEELLALIARHLPLANMRFCGSYAQTDLASIYGGCDLTWAVEYIDRGANSDWCLPNRIYEGGYYNSPPIAIVGSEIAAWLTARGAGVLLQDPATDLEPFITGLTPADYHTLQRASANVPTSDLIWTSEDCRRFARRITNNWYV